MLCSYCIDLDECQLDLDDCAQVCTNTDGSFICSCEEGFTLDNDGKTCNGEYLLTLIICISQLFGHRSSHSNSGLILTTATVSFHVGLVIHCNAVLSQSYAAMWLLNSYAI